MNLGHIYLLQGQTQKALDTYTTCREFYDTISDFKQDLIQDRPLLLELGLKRKDIEEVWAKI